VVDEWYISMDKLRKPLEEIVKKIQWIPGFGLDRELDWIKNMHDWLISKKRYWGLTLPIYECECGHFEVLGSREELEKRAVEGFEKFEGNTPHRPWVDYVKIRCKKCKKIVSRIKDVGNPWLDAGIVPFSTMGYFSDKAQWKKWFPAQVVCESFPGQFKNWFYSLLVMSAVLEDEAPIKTIFGYASVVDEKGEEMHKSKGNSIPLEEALEKVGADPARWLYAKANPAENMRFGYTLIEETKRKLLTLQNVYTFFTTYVQKSDFPKTEEVVSENILDKWIVSKMDHVIGTAEFMLDKYDIGKTVTLIEEFFINDLSLWYLRRSRKRFHEEFAGRSEAIQTLYYVLLNTAKIIAPVMPFFAEQMYQDLRGKDMPESVHLCDWPSKDGKGKTDLELEANMDEVRNVVTMALAERSLKGVKIRQPLLSLKVKNKKSKIKDHDALLELIKDEVNVKQVLFDDSIEAAVELDLQLTEELKEEGMIRDVVRSVQDLRKEQGYKPEDKIMVWFDCPEGISHVLEKNEDFLLREVRGQEFFLTKSPEGVTPKEFMINGQAVVITIKKI
jgi:isoleucyl-tRNA synthetase